MPTDSTDGRAVKREPADLARFGGAPLLFPDLAHSLEFWCNHAKSALRLAARKDWAIAEYAILFQNPPPSTIRVVPCHRYPLPISTAPGAGWRTPGIAA